jgi:hypothetical protein
MKLVLSLIAHHELHNVRIGFNKSTNGKSWSSNAQGNFVHNAQEIGDKEVVIALQLRSLNHDAQLLRQNRIRLLSHSIEQKELLFAAVASSYETSDLHLRSKSMNQWFADFAGKYARLCDCLSNSINKSCSGTF